MSDVVIRVENLSKKYVIRHQGKGSGDGLRHVISDALSAPVRALRGKFQNKGSAEAGLKRGEEEFWALRDVSFEVKRGEVVGIIGRNGAGKSTLLKILSRITEPTSGRIGLKGRVASLLEVGTGFHPELTGRENIFLNGAILGMSQAEVKRKFDEIVAFAEIEKFLDTPVKRYSSGMYVRLAFAVAAHLEPEILIVDEVLAVGDAEFQKKCIGKMQDVSSGGRTVLFVSHNMLAIQKLCTRGIYMEKGYCKAIGNVVSIVENYNLAKAFMVYNADSSNSGKTRIVSAKILTEAPRTDISLEVLVEWFLHESISGIQIGIGFNTSDGERIFGSAPSDIGHKIPTAKGAYKAIFNVPANTFLARTYTIAISLWNNQINFDYPNPALKFAVEAAPSGPYAYQNHREGYGSY